MQKPALLPKPVASHLVLASLLTVGVLLPLLLVFDLGGNLITAFLYAAATLLLLTAAGMKKFKWFALGAMAVFAAIQFVLPQMGFWGGSFEALKAIILYFSGLHVVMPLYGAQVAAMLGVAIAAVSFLFAKKGAGFLPATILVVLVLFALWSLGKGDLVWYALPALVALLLLISQTAHEKISVINVLPMAVVVVLLSLLLLLPAGRVTIPPLEEAASNLRQAITDYLFFTEPRNVFTLGSYGYYPLGGNQLGGEAEPSEYPVMVVKTDRKTLMRGVVKDEYTGRSFRDTSSAKRYLYVNPRWADLRKKVFLEDMPSETIRNASGLLEEKAITVQIQNTGASTTFAPLFLRRLNMENGMVPYFNDASELFITRDIAQGDQYTIYAPVFEGGDGGLDALVSAAARADENYAAIQAQYSQLPEHMEKKVYDDVDNIIAGVNTPYDRALAIMRYLQRYYRYTLTPETLPDNTDFVTHFLYVGKEGYCTYYASAMTVMCRMAGLPARYVEGFVATPSSDGYAYVTGKEGHAWTEVYFEGFGWVPFDATPNQQQQSQEPPPQEPPPPEDEPEDQPPEEEPPEEDPPPEEPPPEEQPEPEKEDNDPTDEDEDPPKPWWILLLLAAAIAGMTVRFRLRRPSYLASKATSAQDVIFIYGNAVYLILKLRGRQPKQGETPMRFAKRMDSIHVVDAPILPLWRTMALSNYSRRQPGKEQVRTAKETYEKVYKGQSLFVKLRFQLTVVFTNRWAAALDTQMVREEVKPKTMLPGMGTIASTGNQKGKGKKATAKEKKERTGKPRKKKAKRTVSKTPGKTPKVKKRKAPNRKKTGRKEP